MTGAKGQHINLKDNVRESNIPFTKEIFEEISKKSDQLPDKPPYNLVLLRSLNGDEDSAYLRFMMYLNETKSLHPKTYEQLAKIFSENFNRPYLAIEQLRVLDDPPIPTQIIKQWETYFRQTNEDPTLLCKVHHYSGRPGSGEYSRIDIDNFNKIVEALTEHCVTISTHDKFKEGRVDGIRPGHAYTVTNAYIETVNGKDLLMITLRNPWGKVGRAYNFKKDDQLKPSCAYENPDAAEFHIDC